MRLMPSLIRGAPKSRSSPTRRFIRPQIREELLGVDGSESLDGAHFDDDPVLHHKIGTKFMLELNAIVCEADRTLPLETKPAPLECRRENDRVDDLERPRSQLLMDCN